MDRLVVRRLAAGVLGLSLLLASTSCTDDSGTGRDHSSAGSTARSAPSAPLAVKVTHVAGELGPRRRAAVARQVRRTLSSYARAAFLGGDYPRRDFSRSFATFTARTAGQARRDQGLLTNRSLGSSTTSVRAVHRTAYLAVLAPRGKVSGATAAVDWLFRVERGEHRAQRVRLKGRLLLTADRPGHWRIFGYDVNRSARAVARSAS